MHGMILYSQAQLPKEAFVVATELFLWHMDAQSWELTGFEITWGRGREEDTCKRCRGRQGTQQADECLWGEIVCEFSMGETGQSTALEGLISGLMHPINVP